MNHGQTIGQWLKWDFETNGDLEIKDKNDKTLYREYASAFWEKIERNYQGKLICYEDSDGKIVDKRPKPSPELTLESLAEDVLKLSELMTKFVNQVNQSNTIK